MSIDSRVEYTPVPIILLILRKMMVMGPTAYPSGELRSTGAPEASWYDVSEWFPPVSTTYLRLPSDSSPWSSVCTLFSAARLRANGLRHKAIIFGYPYVLTKKRRGIQVTNTMDNQECSAAVMQIVYRPRTFQFREVCDLSNLYYAPHNPTKHQIRHAVANMGGGKQPIV